MKIEILHYRDPDSECDLVVYVDGVHVTEGIYIEDIDPGQGYTASEWDESTDWVADNPDLTPAFKAQAIAWRDSGRESQYIDKN